MKHDRESRATTRANGIRTNFNRRCELVTFQPKCFFVRECHRRTKTFSRIALRIIDGSTGGLRLTSSLICTEKKTFFSLRCCLRRKCAAAAVWMAQIVWKRCFAPKSVSSIEELNIESILYNILLPFVRWELIAREKQFEQFGSIGTFAKKYQTG